jgi:diguanylate cyclase (GGDEF)-like protein
MQAPQSPFDILDGVAALTGLRDRDLLDQQLVAVLARWLAVDQAHLHRLSGDEADLRWLTTFRQTTAGQTPDAVPLWMDWRALPTQGDRPDWAHCASIAEPHYAQHPTPALLLPLPGDHTPQGVLELCGAPALDAQALEQLMKFMRVWRHVQGLIDYSERDSLTGLFNRKSFDESFYKASALPKARDDDGNERRQDTSTGGWWLALLDIDHFKSVNDRFGHLIGDEVLLLLSRVMRQCFRFYDQLYRFGGEEFVVLLRCPEEAGAMSALQRFREAVRQFPFPQVQQLTVSIGFTDVRPGDTPSAAVERADKAVYFAKRNGRDQVRHHATLLRDGDLEEDKPDSDVELF